MRIRSQGAADAPALVLIHGLSSSPHSWQRNVAALGARRRLLIVQLFPADAGPRFSVASAAARLAAVLADEPAPVAVAGHSLGGLIAMQLAADAPHLVDRLVLVATPATRSSQSVPAQLAAVAASGARTDLRSMAVVASTILTANPLQLMAATTAALRADLADLAGRIAMPCLLVWGARDAIVPLEIGTALQASLPNASLVVLPEAGHQPQWDQPAAFHAAILPFLEGASA
jgi:pimeloyl-ACP methyl ester carboxylesterase